MESLFVWLSLALTAFVLFILLRDDILFLLSPRQSADGIVTGHGSVIDEGDRVFSARISFTDDVGVPHEFLDAVRSQKAEPAVGTIIGVVYPQGRPDKARVPRPWLRLVIYLLIVGLNLLLVAKLLGFVGS